MQGHVWLENLESRERIFARDVDYEDVLIVWTYADVKKCSLTFSKIPESDSFGPHAATWWLVFDMADEFNVYGVVVVGGVASVPLTNRQVESRRILFQGTESWFRMVTIPILVEEESVVRVQFSFHFVASTSSNNVLHFPFPLFADPAPADELLQAVHMKCRILEPGEILTVVGLLSCDAAEVEASRSDWLSIDSSFEGEMGVDACVLDVWLSLSEEINLETPVALQISAADGMSLTALSRAFYAQPTPRSDSNCYVIWVNVSARPHVDYDPREHARQAARKLMQYIPERADVWVYHYHQSSDHGTPGALIFERKSEDVCVNFLDGGREHEIPRVDDIAKDTMDRILSTENKGTPNLWVFCPVEKSSELAGIERGMTEALRLYHVYIGYNDQFRHACAMHEEVPKECFLPRGLLLTEHFARMIADSVGLSIAEVKPIHLESRVSLADFYRCSQLSRNQIAYANIESQGVLDQGLVFGPQGQETKVLLVDMSDMDGANEPEDLDLIGLFGLMLSQRKVVDQLESQLAHASVTGLENAKELVLRTYEEWAAHRPYGPGRCPHSRLWKLNVSENEGEWVIAPAMSFDSPVLDEMLWLQYAYWNGKDEMTSKARRLYAEWTLSGRLNLRDFERGERLVRVAMEEGLRLGDMAEQLPLYQLAWEIFKNELPVEWQPWYKPLMDELRKGLED